MSSGEIAQSFLAIHFVDATGRACQVIFGKPAPGYQDTNDATVVRNTDGTWTLATFATDVAKLTCNGKGNTVTVEGYFYLPTQYVIRQN
jgi:hypothetical protein